MTVFAHLPQQQQQQSANSSMTASSFKDSSETQTEIIAVHTPQIEHPKDFPFVQQKIQRPSSLPISNSANDSSASTKSNTATTGDEMEAMNGDNSGSIKAVEDFAADA
jgi:hypothetical protein